MCMEKITVLTSLYNCELFLESYFQELSQLEHKEQLKVLLLHNAPTPQELAIIEKQLPKYSFIQHIIIPNRESLYATWNRGVKLATSDYIAIWNVDDIRTPDSLYRQSVLLDNNPEVAMTYGDCIETEKYGDSIGRLCAEPEFSYQNSAFYRNHHIGCFPMWRRSIHKSIGYFDEQFRLVADLDFQIRVVRQFPIKKCEGNMGFFLNEGSTKLSSNRFCQKLEYTMLMMRYGGYDLLDLLYLRPGKKVINYKVIYYDNKYHKIEDIFPNYKSFIDERKKLYLLTIWKQPRFLLAYIKHVILKIN
ncbi:hypothetical protein HMPREF1068_02543 [Bacteroides nordii CL02T12C05]|uniref:Glycosyltransferase 2-like domain-containing protein n=2 Tax=Bacteroides TaxID=816 RepID=I9GSI1_9BACE|nr:hypothetical protein HMPREF1068_02543 [Bacteroides nordii CL02T12C05]GFZ41956.1 hypothetical protein BANORC5_39910 [Bacteroides nordii]